MNLLITGGCGHIGSYLAEHVNKIKKIKKTVIIDNIISTQINSLFNSKKKKVRANYYFLSKKGNLNEAAKNLYSTLRKIKKNNYKSIAVAKIPNKGIGKTINDRLARASKF